MGIEFLTPIIVTGTGRFTGAVTLDTQATTTSHAVKASRTINTGTGLSGGGDLTADRTYKIAIPGIAGGRLSTEAGVPVSTSDQAAPSILHYMPFVHNLITLYDGSAWLPYDFPEFSYQPVSLTSGKNYDVFVFAANLVPSSTNTTTDILTFSSAHGLSTGSFCRVSETGGGLTAGTDYFVNEASSTTLSLHTTLANAQSGTNKVNLSASITATLTCLALEFSAAWTNDTTRADALTTQNGVKAKSGATTRMHLGMWRATGSNSTADTEAKRFVWNEKNQVLRGLSRVDTTTHNYNSATTRQWNNDAANQVEFVTGEYQSIFASVRANIDPGVGGDANTGIGVDTTTASSNNLVVANKNLEAITVGMSGYVPVAAGYHFLALTEREVNSVTSSFINAVVKAMIMC